MSSFERSSSSSQSPADVLMNLVNGYDGDGINQISHQYHGLKEEVQKRINILKTYTTDQTIVETESITKLFVALPGSVDGNDAQKLSNLKSEYQAVLQENQQLLALRAEMLQQEQQLEKMFGLFIEVNEAIFHQPVGVIRHHAGAVQGFFTTYTDYNSRKNTLNQSRNSLKQRMTRLISKYQN